MKKYIATIVSTAVIASSLLTGIAGANEGRDNMMSAKPIIKDVLEKDLRQELNLKESHGRTICAEVGSACPASVTGAQTEALLKAAKITRVGADAIAVSIFTFTYEIDMKNAKIVRNYWGQSSVNEFSVGDIVNVHGYVDAANSLLIHAKTVRNVSIQQRHGVFKGKIESVTAPDTFVLSTERGKQTVKVSADTKITVPPTQVVCVTAPCPAMPERIGTFADIQVGQTVMVRGLWNSTSSTINAYVVIIGGEYSVRPLLKEKRVENTQAKLEKKIDQVESKIEKTKDENTRKLEELQKLLNDLQAKLKVSSTATTTTP